MRLSTILYIFMFTIYDLFPIIYTLNKQNNIVNMCTINIDFFNCSKKKKKMYCG